MSFKNFYSKPERKIPITSCVHRWKEEIKLSLSERGNFKVSSGSCR